MIRFLALLNNFGSLRKGNFAHKIEAKKSSHLLLLVDCHFYTANKRIFHFCRFNSGVSSQGEHGDRALMDYTEVHLGLDP